MKQRFYLLIVFGVLLSFSSCKVFYPNIMFQQKDYQYFELAKKQIEQYVIQPGDLFTLKAFSRDGFRLIDVLGNVSSQTNIGGGGASVSYLVDHEGFADLPIVGEFYVKGYTEAELERVLAEKYSNLFVDPYIVLTVTNRRAFVFKGSTASVVLLNEAPTNLFEVIAKSGGIANDLKSYKIKVIRGDLKNPQISVIDLSSLEGMRNADLIVQSNDIIYIEPRRRPASDVLRELAPIFAWASAILTTIALIRTFSGTK
ncbi:MAG: polysaccharide biosynthesis/export family protein [Chitinophagales bacterium]|jgi:polysaccharide export outer membrane protein|nr:polysaccharide biosynthesis/export family protein [Chitinophagales bacterium]